MSACAQAATAAGLAMVIAFLAAAGAMIAGHRFNEARKKFDKARAWYEERLKDPPSWNEIAQKKRIDG